MAAQNRERWAQIGIVVQFLALIRTLGRSSVCSLCEGPRCRSPTSIRSSSGRPSRRCSAWSRSRSTLRGATRPWWRWRGSRSSLC